jgi:hypothetical protein
VSNDAPAPKPYHEIPADFVDAYILSARNNYGRRSARLIYDRETGLNEIIIDPAMLEPAAEDQVGIAVVESVSVVVTPPAAPQAVQAKWLESAAFFIPKSIREPFIGDLREDVADMARTGHSRAAIWWRLSSQLALLAVKTWLSIRRR